MSFDNAWPTNIRPVSSAATSFCTSAKLGAARVCKADQHNREWLAVKGERRTVAQILLPNTRNPRPVVRNLFSRSDEAVENDAAVVVDDRDAREGRLDAFGTDTDHLAVDSCDAKASAGPRSCLPYADEPRYCPVLRQEREVSLRVLESR